MKQNPIAASTRASLKCVKIMPTIRFLPRKGMNLSLRGMVALLLRVVTLGCSFVLVFASNAVAASPVHSQVSVMEETQANIVGSTALATSDDGSIWISAWDTCNGNVSLLCRIKISSTRNGGVDWSKPIVAWTSPRPSLTTSAGGSLLQWKMVTSKDGESVSIAILSRNFDSAIPTHPSSLEWIVVATQDGGRHWSPGIVLENRVFNPETESNSILDLQGPPQISGSTNLKVQAVTWTDAHRLVDGTYFFDSLISVSHDGGNSWSQPQSLPNLSGERTYVSQGDFIAGTRSPTITISRDGSRMLSTWSNFGNAEILSTGSKDGGISWSTRVKLGEGYSWRITADSELTQVSVMSGIFNGNVGLSFEHLGLTQSRDLGKSWTSTKEVFLGGDGQYSLDSDRSSFTSEGKKLFLSAVSYTSLGGAKLWSTSSLDGGATWSNPILQESGTVVFPLASFVSEDGVHILSVWWVIDAARNEVVLTERTNTNSLISSKRIVKQNPLSFLKIIYVKQSNLILFSDFVEKNGWSLEIQSVNRGDEFKSKKS